MNATPKRPRRSGSHRARENTANAQIGIGTLAASSCGPTHGIASITRIASVERNNGLRRRNTSSPQATTSSAAPYPQR